MPTFRQARALASALRIPFGYLFLSRPPKAQTDIPDLRTFPDRRPALLSRDLIEVLNDARRKQDWYRETLLGRGEPELLFVGAYTAVDAPETVARDMREALNIAAPLRASIWEEHLKLLVDRAETTRISVLRSGIVGSNTRRPLPVDELRGFALADSMAPVVFVNSKDSVAARIFTIAHELAHIWLGASGVSNADPTETESIVAIERSCNRIAAEFLVPKSRFQDEWARNRTEREWPSTIARRFKVSSMVIVRRAYELELIARGEFFERLESERDKQRKPPKRSGRGDYYTNLRARNGAILTTEIVSSVLEGSVSYREASVLLGGASAATIQHLALKKD